MRSESPFECGNDEPATPDFESLAGIEHVATALDEMFERVLVFERTHAARLDGIAPGMVPSARNLLHYLAVRQLDLRPLQKRLRASGLSSLGRLEPCVLCSILAARRLASVADDGTGSSPVPTDFEQGATLIAERATRLFGDGRAGRDARIMVTMPGAAAEDPDIVDGLVEGGMDVMRINTAHDDQAVWLGLIARARASAAQSGRRPRVALDLPGPKPRTRLALPRYGVRKVKPLRGLRGEVLEPTVIAVGDRHRMPLPNAISAAMACGDRLEFYDPRGRWRAAQVIASGDGLGVAFARTVYLETDMAVRLARDGELLAQGRLGDLAPVEQPLLVKQGERLRLLRRCEPDLDDARRIACTLPAVLADVQVGHRVWFDDGRIGAIVVAVDDEGIEVAVDHAKAAGSKLHSEKSIQLPDTPLRLPAVGNSERTLLDAMAGEVDLVGLSFVQTAQDVLDLHAALDAAGVDNVGVVLKIETRLAFDNLPEILLAAMRRDPFAVMVARGDLAVEVGFDRLAEIQEELLWLCEAAHAPLIWATQVLESMATKGLPSRAEVTDAAMAERAECVMLNKGPYIGAAVRFLDNVLRRMQKHQYKKTPRLRRLGVSELGPEGA